LAVEPVKGNLRLSGYSACGQDGGVQLPRGYIEGTFYLLHLHLLLLLLQDINVSFILINERYNLLVHLHQKVSLMPTWFFW
jgi:hypothetical protein